MKVYIGPYTSWVGPYQIADKIFFWVNKNGIYADDPPIFSRWDYKLHEKFGDWLADIEWLNKLCNWIESKKERKVKIRIDNYDTWSMDHTLALIIHPMLVQLKEQKHGGPFVADEDVPEHLRSTNAKPVIDDGVDEFHFDRWDWVLDEMIWTFKTLNEDWSSQFYTPSGKFMEGEFDAEGRQKMQDRINNGLRLFGKYYQSLWD